MKTITTVATSVALLLCLHHAKAQTPPLNTPDYNKPKIFAALPERLAFHLSTAEALFALAKDAPVNTAIADGLMLKGTVMSKFIAADSAIKSITVRTITIPAVVFSFSRLRKGDGTISYKAQLVSSAAGDAFELLFENNSWVLRKRGYYDLVNE